MVGVEMTDVMYVSGLEKLSEKSFSKACHISHASERFHKLVQKLGNVQE
jgi:hypothetical protein